MSTLRKDKSCRGSDLGITVVELVVVVMILGLLVTLIGAPLQMTSQLSKTSLDRLVEAVDTNLSIRLLTQQISSSQILRSSGVKCDGQSAALQTGSRALIQMRPGSQDRFSLPFASVSSVGGLSQTDEAVHVSDANLYQPGDLVVMMSAENSNNMGLFQVISRRDADSSLFLREASFSSPDVDCRFGKGYSLADFKKGASSRGERSVFVQRLQIAVYSVSGNNIGMKLYPQAQDSEGPGTSVFTDFRSFQMQTYWQERTSTASAGSEEVDGTFTASARIELLELDPNLAQSNQCQGKGERQIGPTSLCRDGQYYNVRPVNVFGRFLLSSSKRMNPKVQTAAVPKANLFPTCYIHAQPMGVALDIPQGMNFPPPGTNKNYRMFMVSGAVSEVALQMVNLGVNATSRAGGSIYCINREELPGLKNPNPSQRIRPEDVQVFSDSFAMAGTPQALDEMICAVSGKAELTAVLSYFDPGMMRSSAINCRESVGVDAVDDGVYDYWGGKKMTCLQVGACGRVPTVYDPRTNKVKQDVLYQLECSWNDGGKRDCCVDPRDASKKMTEIRFRVTSVKMQDPSELRVACEP